MSNFKAQLGANAPESMGINRAGLGSAGGPKPIVARQADPLEGTERDKDARQVPIDLIQPDPDQPRTEIDPDELAELAESLKAYGQVQPIVVRPGSEPGRFVIIVGERRYRAATLAGWTLMKAVIKTGLTPAEIFDLQVIENLQRSNLKPIEEGRTYRRKMDQNKWSALKVAEAYKISESKVIRALAFADLPASVQDLLAQGRLAPSVAYELSKLNDDAQAESIAARIVSEDLTRADAVAIVTEYREQATGKPVGKGGKSKEKTKAKSNAKLKVRTEWKHAEQGGLRIIASRAKGLEAGQLLDALERWASAIRAAMDQGAAEVEATAV